MVISIARKQFSVDQYSRMAEAGILAPGDRVELIEGEIVDMSPMGSLHAACVDRLTQRFVLAFVKAVVVRVQSPVRLSDFSEPEPDFSILKPREDFYCGGHPGPEDVLALVEVADSTIAFDRQVKVPLYGRSGIREVWIVDLNGGAVEVYREPQVEGYGDVTIFQAGDTVGFEFAAEIAFAVEEILGGKNL